MGYTATILVSGTNNSETLKHLIERGDDIDIHNNEGITAIIKSYSSWNDRNTKILLKAGAYPLYWPFEDVIYLNQNIIKTKTHYIIAQHLIEEEGSDQILSGKSLIIITSNPDFYQLLTKKKTLAETWFLENKTYLDIYNEPYDTLFAFARNKEYPIKTKIFNELTLHRTISIPNLLRANQKQVRLEEQKKLLQDTIYGLHGRNTLITRKIALFNV